MNRPVFQSWCRSFLAAGLATAVGAGTVTIPSLVFAQDAATTTAPATQPAEAPKPRIILETPGIDPANRPVAEVRVVGLKLVEEKLIRNQLRVSPGDAYDATVVSDDIIRITHLGRFSSVEARIQPKADGTLILTYAVAEQPLLSDVQVVGNKELTDQELLRLALLRAGDPIDPFLIERGIQEIKRAYQKKGYFVTEVTYDKAMLNESGILLYRIREGPMPRVQEIKFEGNKVFEDDIIASRIRSSTAIKLIFFYLRDGELDKERLDTDAARIRDLYQERGYLDAQVGRRIDLSPDQKDAVVVFVIDEGKQYTVDKIRFEDNQIFTDEQIAEVMTLKKGDIYSEDRRKKSEEAIATMYGKLGFIEIKPEIERRFHQTEPRVDVVVRIRHQVTRERSAAGEGQPYLVGKVSTKGNVTTKSKVILRQTQGLNPGERYDREGIKKTEQRLSQSALFDEARITVQGDTGDPIRDLIIEVKEKNTGSISFGAGVNSDAGLMGAIELTQRNFDITDYPESAGELFSGKAFRGAGQYFNLALQPGSEFSQYSVNFREPYLFESDFFLDTSLFYFQRQRDKYDEERIGGNAGIGQRFGDVWSGVVRFRGESINIGSIESDAPVDVFDVQGDSMLTAVSLSLIRNTTDNRAFPTVGSYLEMSVSRAGALGGDFDFTVLDASFRKFWTVDEDFFGRRTVFSMRTQVSYIVEGDAPVFERLYAGGHRSFRGFRFRGVSPKGIRNDTKTLGDDSVGGNFMFLVGPEYNFPIYQDVIRFVIFSDTGTVDDEVSFGKYRVSVGAGLRIKIPFLGQAPFAIDFAYPVIKQETDDVRYVSFDLSIPF